MDITFKGRHTSVPERFRRHASGKLAKLEKLDQKAIRIDVEVSKERNPRQADRSERVELTVRSRGPAIRAEAAADDRYAALDLAFAKLEGRLRKAAERRKAKRSDLSVRSAEALAAVAAAPGAIDGTSLMNEIAEAPERARGRGSRKASGRARARGGRSESLLALPETDEFESESGPHDGSTAAHASTDIASGGARVGAAAADDAAADGKTMVVPIQMEGEGPLVVREKFHASSPMTIDQALLEMELVGHDFYAFSDKECGKFSVVYRRRGYDYGVIRLVEED